MINPHNWVLKLTAQLREVAKEEARSCPPLRSQHWPESSWGYLASPLLAREPESLAESLVQATRLTPPHHGAFSQGWTRSRSQSEEQDPGYLMPPP